MRLSAMRMVLIICLTSPEGVSFAYATHGLQIRASGFPGSGGAPAPHIDRGGSDVWYEVCGMRCVL